MKLQFELSRSSFKPITLRGNKTIIIKAAFQSEGLMRTGGVSGTNILFIKSVESRDAVTITAKNKPQTEKMH